MMLDGGGGYKAYGRRSTYQRIHPAEKVLDTLQKSFSWPERWPRKLKIEATKGIPKNLSSQVFGEVRVNFLG